MSKPNQLNSSPVFVRFAGKSDKAKLRTEVYQGRDHVVLPIVALVGEIVVTGMNSDGPEYIPAHVLAAAPAGWNGRPVVNVHPTDADGNGSFANTPDLWEQMCFGQAFNVEFADNRLRVDCYLDPKKAEQVGEGAVEVLAKAEAGEMVEVSVGAWVWLEDEEGTSPSGESYSHRWAALVPDHIAVGLQSQGAGIGACSVEMGCGGPRYYTAAQATNIRNLATITKELPVKPTFMTSLLKNVNVEALASDLGMSTNELAMRLSKALRAAVPGFLYVADIYPDSSTLIYIAMPKDEYEYYRCKYDASSDEATTSLHKKVEPSLTYKPVANTSTEGGDDDEEVAIASNGTEAPCQCQHHKQAATVAAKETNMKKVKELAGKLVACAAAPFTADDTAKLEAMSEAQLESLVKVYSEPQPTPAPEPTPTPEPQPEPKPAPETVTLTKEQHQHLTQLALREAAREKKRRTHLIAALVADESVKAIYGGEKELGERTTDELEKLAQLVGVDDGNETTVDMRAQAGVLAPPSADEKYEPLNSWGVRGALATSLGMKPAN